MYCPVSDYAMICELLGAERIDKKNPGTCVLARRQSEDNVKIGSLGKAMWKNRSVGILPDFRTGTGPSGRLRRMNAPGCDKVASRSPFLWHGPIHVGIGLTVYVAV